MSDEPDQSAPGVCPGRGCCRVCGRRNGNQVVVPYPMPSLWMAESHEQTLAHLRLLASLPGTWELRASHRAGDVSPAT
jgi:hypothetical protein